MIQVWQKENELDRHFYNIATEPGTPDEHTEHILSYSDDDQWTGKGEVCMKLLDTDDGYIVYDEAGVPFELTYHEAEQLFALLLYLKQGPMELKTTQTIKSVC